jgi:DNA-binding response OmpR family regulator
MSGYSEHPGIEELGVDLIAKPFQAAELMSRVRRLLDHATTRG